MDGPSVGELLFRLLASLAVVVGLLFLIARLVKGKSRTGRGAAVQVVARQQLSRGAGVSVITIGERVLVLGTTEHQVSLLAEMDPEELLSADEVAALTLVDEDPDGFEYDELADLTGVHDVGTFTSFEDLTVPDSPQDLETRAAAAAFFGTTTPPTDLAARRRRLDVVPEVEAKPTRRPKPATTGRSTPHATRQGPLTGSVLSPQTWKQTLAFFTGDRSAKDGPPDPDRRPAS